ncbi:MAG: mechanosensitive ion channel family protein [Cyclobacteriaceae bacterium]
MKESNIWLTFFNENTKTVLVTVGLTVLFVVIRSVTLRLIRRHSVKSNVPRDRQIYIRKLSTTLVLLLYLTVIGAAWEISLKGLSVYFASIFTVVGVALFATWSMLSNLTASIIIFFFFPYRIGQRVKIVDGDNSIEGKIADITLFYILIETLDNKMCSYPNNLAIQKPLLLSD